MNILLLGSGGREHAIAWKIVQSEKVKKLYIAPGNPGTALLGENIDIDILDFDKIKKVCLKCNIDMLIVGPEEPLVKGITDFFKNDLQLQNIYTIGPSKTGAMLEGSKNFAKSFMKKYNIPTADYNTFNKSTINQAYQFVNSIQAPYVIKADGLAAGKGVVIANDYQEAKAAIDDMLLNEKFGKSSTNIVIEKFLNGIEISIFILTDGSNYLILPEAKDYKKISDGEQGLNTGGMGAVSPVKFASKTFIDKVEKNIIIPTIEGLKSEKIDYKGFIFIGLMNVNGEPYVIEYNVRMGDPETESVFPRIKSDIVDAFIAAATGNIKNYKLEISEKHVVTVVLVSKGYPEQYSKGFEINGLNNINESFCFHAGTKLNDDVLITNGGRVLAITSIGNTMNDAINKSYRTIDNIDFNGKTFRKDIGFDIK